MSIHDKRMITLLIEQRLEVDGVDTMAQIILKQSVPDDFNLEHVLDKIREILEQSKKNQFTFL